MKDVLLFTALERTYDSKAYATCAEMLSIFDGIKEDRPSISHAAVCYN